MPLPPQLLQPLLQPLKHESQPQLLWRVNNDLHFDRKPPPQPVSQVLQVLQELQLLQPPSP